MLRYVLHTISSLSHVEIVSARLFLRELLLKLLAQRMHLHLQQMQVLQENTDGSARQAQAHRITVEETRKGEQEKPEGRCNREHERGERNGSLLHCAACGPRRVSDLNPGLVLILMSMRFSSG